MRAPIRKELVSRFSREFEGRFHAFSRLSRKEAGDCPMWALKLAPTLTLFVMLQPVNNKDVFYVEIAWSDDGEFPFGHIGTTLEPGALQARTRLGWLWHKGQTDPPWAIVPEQTDEEFHAELDAIDRGEKVDFFKPPPPVEEVLPRLAPLVDDAVGKLVQYALPLFRRVAEHRGLKWPAERAVPTTRKHAPTAARKVPKKKMGH